MSVVAKWLDKMPLGMEVGLCPADFVFDEDPAPPPKKAHPSTQFLAHIYCGPTSWMDQDASWYGVKSWPRRHCGIWGRNSQLPPPKRHSPLVFRLMSIVAKRLDG